MANGFDLCNGTIFRIRWKIDVLFNSASPPPPHPPPPLGFASLNRTSIFHLMRNLVPFHDQPLAICVLYIVCTLLLCLYAGEWIDTYHRSRSCFWQDCEECVINRHVLKVEWCQLGHEGDGLSTQPGCLRAESKPAQSQILDLWKNVCWTINSRDAWLREDCETRHWHYHVSIILFGEMGSPTSHWLHIFHDKSWTYVGTIIGR